MRLLVIGGTLFLGRHIVDAARAQGHEVTVANRGKTNSDLYPNLERLAVDRNGDLGPLRRGRWDAVIDTCGYVPGHTRSVAEALHDRVEHYSFVSTVSVYAGFPRPGLGEDNTLVSTEGVDVTQVTNETYGALKVLCEHEVRDVFADRACVVRPGLIVGPYDPSDRFTYWPRRFDLGGEAIVPVTDQKVQLADARDLAEWMVRLAASRTGGVFNGCGPATPWTFGEMIDACVRAAGDNAARPVPVDEQFLLDRGVTGWSMLPVWPPKAWDAANMFDLDVSAAVAAGLTFRPLDTVVADTLAWDSTRRAAPLQGPLDAAKEREVLTEWKAR